MPAAAPSVDRSFAALSHPVRRAILDRLCDGALTVGEIAAPFAMKKPTISRHLKVLEDAGLIARSIHGRQHRCRLRADGLRDVRAWIERYDRFWSGQLDALGDYLERQTPADSA